MGRITVERRKSHGAERCFGNAGNQQEFPRCKGAAGCGFYFEERRNPGPYGRNGARKSTLIKVLTGVEEFETGTIRMEGSSNTIINRSPQEAQENGISTVYQEVNLCPNLSVAENLYIGREPKKVHD